LKHVRTRLTYANVMSSLAVFLVLGGGAAVAAGLGKNTVGTAQIKRNAVKVGKLAPEAVKAGKLAKNAVPTNRLRDNAVSADKIANGSVLTDKITDEAVTSGKLAKESVLTDKIGDAAVTGGKLANDAVTTDKIGDAAVSNPKLANEAVTAGKLTPSERSEAFQTQNTGLLNTEMNTGLLGNYTTANSVVSRTLPAGNYVVFAKTELINSAIEERSVICRLFDDGTQIDQGSSLLGQLIIVTQGTVSTMGVSDGGTLHLRCRASGASVFAFNRELVAIRMGSIG
jgi:hypothetical protein